MVAALVVLGLVVLATASAPVGYDKFGDQFFFVKRQLLFGVLPGVVAFLFFARKNPQSLHVWSSGFYFFTLGLLVAVFIPGIGLTINGSHSWLHIFSFTFQPTELAKLAMVVLLARLLTDPKRNVQDFQYGLMPILTLLLPVIALIALQPDVGTLSILVVMIFAMLYVGKVPATSLSILGLAGVVLFGALIIAAPYRIQRLTTFLHPELDPQGVGYQVNQAFLAIGSGGINGLGLGHSRQKYQYLPEVSADSIFAVFAEEMGFVFSTIFVLFILTIGWFGFRIAKYAPDDFSRLLVVGIMVWFLWQSFLNIGAIMGVLPLTGVPLPLVSHGGSSVMVMLGAFGVVAGVALHSERVKRV